MKHILSAAALGCICLAVPAAEPAFYLNFDENTTPVKAAPGTVVNPGTPAKYDQGVRGKALVVGTDEEGKRYGVSCTRTGNFNWEKGSMSFWFKPLNWEGKDSGFFASFFSAGNNKESFLLYKYHEADSVFFMRGANPNWIRCAFGAKHFQKGEWHHIVCTWDKGMQKFFCDGRLFSEVKVSAALPDPGTKEFVIGENAGSILLRGKGRLSLVDEFKLFDEVLSQGEIAELYLAETPGTLPVQKITLGNFRDAFTGIGLSDKVTREIVLDKARYTLGRDAQKLYVTLDCPVLAGEKAEAVFQSAPGGKELLKPMTAKAPGKFALEVPLKEVLSGKAVLFNIRCGKYDLNGFSQLVFDDNAPRINFFEAFDLTKKVYSVRAKKAAGVSLEIEGRTGKQYGVFTRTGSLNTADYFTRHPLKERQCVSFRFIRNGKVIDCLEYGVRTK